MTMRWPTGLTHITARAARLRTSSMTLFLVLLLITIFVIPMVTSSYGELGRTLVEGFFLLILLSGAWAIAEHRAAAAIVAMLCLCMLLITVSGKLWPGSIPPLTREVAALLAVMLLAVFLGTRVFARGRITTDRIMGAIALYLALGIVWGNAYEIVALLDDKAFAGTPDQGRGMERWFYFSFVTLTTVGYGDITPMARAARALAMLEALVGQLYPAIILARLVTLQTSATEADDEV